MFILILFNLVQSQNWIEYSFAFPQLVPLVVDKTIFSRSLQEFGQLLNVSIYYNDQDSQKICNFDYQYLILNQIPSTFLALVTNMQQIDIDNLKTEEIQQGFQEEIISYTQSNNNLIILEKNGNIHNIQIDKNSKQINHTNYNITIFSESKNNQYIIYDNDAYYYVDNEQFSKFIIQDNNLYQFTFTNWQTQKINGHFKILIKNNQIYVINGNQGLHIYTMENHTLILNNIIKNIYQDPLKLYNLVDIQFYQDYLYVLDQENGVKRFYLQNNTIDQEFHIHYLGCTLFSIINDTMILVSQNLQRSIVLEYKQDQNNNWLLIRKKILQKQLIRNIKQFNNYAILMSNQYNHIYQKNLLENYTDTNLLKGYNFYQQGLLGFEDIDDNYSIAIFKYGVEIYYKIEYPGYLVCQASKAEFSNIIIEINSTNCLNKNQSDTLNYCQSKLNYEFDIHSPLMSQFQEEMYIYMCLVSAAIAIALIAAIFLIYRKYQIKKEMIDKEKQKKLRGKKKSNLN